VQRKISGRHEVPPPNVFQWCNFTKLHELILLKISKIAKIYNGGCGGKGAWGK
jgi:hypothetical protein